MNPWPFVVVGIWLLYTAWEDMKDNTVDLGVPIAIILTRVAVEGPWWIPSAFRSILPLYLFMKFLEKAHYFMKRDDPVWGEGDTALITAVAMFLGLDLGATLSYTVGAMLVTVLISLIVHVFKGQPLRALTDPMPLGPGVLIMYAITVGTTMGWAP